MKTELVAAFSQEIHGNAPEWIMFAPAGKHNISAKVNGRPSKVTVTVDPAAATALQSDLEARKASGGSQPFFDLHHDAREASAYPEEFQWREDGIWARVRWTPAGLAATKADPEAGILPSVRYFSPRCAIANGRIVGLMDAATGNAAGGLVSDPAFTQIALVASLTPTPKIMDKKRLMKMAGYADDLEDVDEMELMSKLEAMCGGGGKKDMKAAKAIEDLTAAKATAESERDAIKAQMLGDEYQAKRLEASEQAAANRALKEQEMIDRGAQRAADRQAREDLKRTPTVIVHSGGGSGSRGGIKAPSGYRYNEDGTALEPIPGGPADKSGNKPLTAKQLETQRGFMDLESSIGNYEKLLGGYDPRGGTAIDPATRAALEGAYTDVQMKLKTLYELGAPQAGDLKLLSQSIPNPVDMWGTARGVAFGSAPFKAKLNETKKLLSASRTNFETQMGKETPAAAAPVEAPKPARRKYNSATGMLE